MLAMSLKIFCAVVLLFSSFVNAKNDKFSFTIAIDNTMSMTQEINGVKLAASRIVDAVLNSGSALIENYVLVAINDPDVHLLTVTNSTDEFKRQIDAITLYNNKNLDCPELALQGVEMAIENSLPRSLVYVFTDADAKDKYLLEKVRNQAFRKQIQIVFVLTEACSTDYDPTYDALATATNGVVFKGDKSTKVDEILNYAVEAVKKRRIVIGKGTFPPGPHNMNVSIDPTMPDVIGVGFGKNVEMGKVYNPDGTLANTDTIVDTPDAKVIKVNCSQPGDYNFNFGSSSTTSVMIQASTSLDFNHGFSLKKPISIPGTSTLPLPGVKSHLAIDVMCDKEVLIEKVELHDLSKKLLMDMPLEKLREKFYVTEPFIPPSGLFFITIKGVLVKSKTPIIRTTATPIEAQNIKFVTTKAKSPTITMDKATIDVEYGQPLSITCDVQAYPAPTIVWYDNVGNEVSSNVENYEIPYGHKNVLEVSNSDKNTTYTCKAKNLYGEVTSIVTINTARRKYFDVLSRPSDTKIDYRKSAKIDCVVDSYPLSTIKWNKGDKEITIDINTEIINNGTTLHIKRATEKDAGTYSCNAQNGLNSTAMFFNIEILGVAPVVSIEGSAQQIVEYDATINLECKVTGLPTPKILWIEINSGNVIPSTTVYSVDREYDFVTILHIDNAKKNATYQCLASNDKGADSKKVEVMLRPYINILKAPKDTNIEYRKSAEIECIVDSSPPSTIIWKKDGKEVVVDIDSNIKITKSGTTLHIKQATEKHNGNYSCNAQNGHNSTAAFFNINILDVAPVVNIDGNAQQIVEYDATVNLKCKVTGLPAPRITWKDIDGDIIPSTATASDDKEYDVVSTATISAEKNATYQCLASNAKGEDSKNVDVLLLVYLNIKKAPKDLSVPLRSKAKTKCKVAASPPAEITWYKDDVEIRSDSTGETLQVIPMSDGSSTLSIDRMKSRMAGEYSCKAANGFLKENIKFKVTVTEIAAKTYIDEAPKINAEYEQPLSLVCNVSGYPEPQIEWQNKDTGKEVPSSLARGGPGYDYAKILLIDKVNKNETYTCKAKNSLGEHSTDVQIETVRKAYFDVLEKPKDTTIKYKGNGLVICNIDAKPPADILWYKDDILLKNTTHISISQNRTVLSITDMQPESIGSYTCRPHNKDNEKNLPFTVRISGITKPKISPSEDEVEILEGSKAVIQCRIVSGDPTPTISWRYMSVTDTKFRVLKDSGSEITIYNVTRNQAGAYRCIASNPGGSDRSTIELVVQYPPEITVTNEKLVSLMEGESKVLYCDATGGPRPTVTWLLNDTLLDRSEFQFISDNNIKIKASVRNIGKFTCLAKNKVGEATVSTTIDYIEPVKIEIPKDTKLEVMEGKEIIMDCIADGYPIPTITWSIITLKDSTPKLYPRQPKPSPDTLVITAQLERAAFYTCTADNGKSAAKNLTYEVIVYAPPRILATNDKFRAVKGDLVLRIPCIATGWPKPDVQWIKEDGRYLSLGTEWYDMADDGTLLIKNIDEGESYYCLANNKYGTDNKLFNVQLDEYPTPLPPSGTVKVYEGQTAHVKCNLPHQLVDQLRWYKDGRLRATGELTLSNVSMSDAGDYTCRVSSLAGSESSTVSVQVFGY